MDKHSLRNAAKNLGRDDTFVVIILFNFIIDNGKHFYVFLFAF